MTRRRSMHALLGTVALIAGCSTTHRAEVSGVVRDRATGRAIPGARLIGADGALARTDVNGRFTLYVRPGTAADVRVSAEGHTSEHVELEGLDMDVELAATSFEGDSFVIPSSELHVLSFTEDTWADDAGPGDGGIETSHVTQWGGSADGVLGGGAACVGCHADVALEGAHAALADTCLACHAERLGSPAASCGRCHGDGITSAGGIATQFLQIGGSFVYVDADGVPLDDDEWPAIDPHAPDRIAH